MRYSSIDDRTKMVAVGEVLVGCETLSAIAQRHRISIGYLSILASRARKALESKASQRSLSHEQFTVEKLVERVEELEKRFLHYLNY